MKGLVLSGGTGSRLRPLTHTGPKQLVPVANKPVIQYGIRDLRKAGITDIGVILGSEGGEEIQDFLGDGEDFGVDITYILQGQPLGLAHAVSTARQFVAKDDFVVYLGDNILKRGISGLVEGFESGDNVASIALQTVEEPQEFGIAEVDGAGRVTALVEKPEAPPSDLALIGIYVFSSSIFDAIDQLQPSARGELEITDAIQSLIDEGGSIHSHIVDTWWKDTGKPEDIIEANRLVLQDLSDRRDGTVESGADVRGNVDLAAGSTVRKGAVVRGPVVIGENATVNSGTYVGPYTSVGPNTRLGGVHVENSVVVGECVITTSGPIVHSIIGRGAELGSSERMLPEGQRMVIGENSKLNL
jgi:glucose-1-phosphate thymidylyltransferase